MRLAMEAPIPNLEEIKQLTDFDFILGHLVQQSLEYTNFFAKSVRFKILDNSANELSTPIDLDTLLQIAEKVVPYAIILPDYAEDSEKTLWSVKTALKSKKIPEAITVYAAVQGSTVEECIRLGTTYYEMGLTHIALPCDVVCGRKSSMQVMGKTRYSIAKELGKLPFKAIHLLGVSLLEELSWYTEGLCIKSVDTGAPIINALKGKRFGADELVLKGIHFDFNAEIPEANLNLVWYNIAMLRRYMVSYE